MTRVALYARYSSDNQSATSIEDQLRICREHAAHERWQIVRTYQDAAISGASVILRPGVQALLQDAQRGKFDMVLAEALGRVSAIRPTWRHCSSISASRVCRSSR
jgi:DNA invertase Pin-like site-specific DNA recombinase